MNLFVNGILLLLLMALLLHNIEASATNGIFKDPAHPGKCAIKPNLILNPGETAKHPDIECARILCGQNSFAEIHTCGLEMPFRYCKLGEPKFPNADYPICCPRKHICGTFREQPTEQPTEQTTVQPIVFVDNLYI